MEQKQEATDAVPEPFELSLWDALALARVSVNDQRVSTAAANPNGGA
jgi:hypothetical protein